MEPASSVLAFLSRYVAVEPMNPEARQVLESFDARERRLLILLARVADSEERRRSIEVESGEQWSAARLARSEAMAMSRLRRLLSERGLLRP